MHFKAQTAVDKMEAARPVKVGRRLCAVSSCAGGSSGANG